MKSGYTTITSVPSLGGNLEQKIYLRSINVSKIVRRVLGKVEIGAEKDIRDILVQFVGCK